MDDVDARIALELDRRLDVVETLERDDPSRQALSGAQITLFVGVSIGITVLGILVLAL